MSLKDCIDRAVTGGEMDPVRAAETKTIYDEIEAEYLDALGLEGARVRAAQETVAEVKRRAAIKRRQEVLTAQVRDRIEKNMRLVDPARVGVGELDIALIDDKGVQGLPKTWRSAEGQRRAVLGLAHARMEQVLARFRRTIVGETRDKATLLDVVREAHGQKTGNGAARELADAWYETAEYMRLLYNDAGGQIGRLERWGMPHSHDSLKVGEAGFEQWRDFIWGRLDRDRMTDNLTGRAMSDMRMEQALRDAYETIRTDGMNKVGDGAAGGGRSLANRRNDHRFLHFKTADDWIAYQDEFGTADAWSAMNGHISHMARDIGAMRALGPNPAATLKWRQSELDKQAAGLGKAGAKRANRLQSVARHLPVLFDNYSGAINDPGNARAARFFAGSRSVLVSAHLGSAAITAIGDVAFQRVTAKFNGLSHTRILARQIKLLSPGNMEDRKLALRLSLIAEEWSQVASAQMRYIGEVQGPEVATRLADGVLRASGLSAWTQAGRWAFGMEFMGAMADHAGRRFDELPKPMQRQFGNYGFTSGDWDVIRKTDIYEPDKGGFLRPDDLIRRDDIAPDQAEVLGMRLLSMIHAETEFGTPTTSIRGSAALGGSTRPGTFAGELVRSGMMYKSFAITMYFTHIRRMAQQQGLWNKTTYAANLVVGATLMGALAIQLKDIARGRDPRSMTGDNASAFWLAAMAQGGGLGLFGDYMFDDANRFGGGLAESVAGPVVSAANDLRKLTIGNVQEAVQGEETNIGREALNFAGRYAPGASLWYARLGVERTVLDQIQRQVDPDHSQNWHRIERKHARELGTQYFWPKGELLPDRAPKFGNAMD